MSLSITQNTVRRSLQLMLRPIARLCLRHGLDIHDLLDGVKSALVAEAQNTLEASNERVNVSRISVATGIHRKDVARLLEEVGSTTEPVNLASRVVTAWESNPQFCTKAGKPKILSIDGPISEFAELVRTVTKDVHPRGVMAQLERLAMVENTPTGLKLRSGAQNVRADLGKAYHVLGQDVADLTETVECNTHLEDDAPNLHARTEFDNIFVESIPEVRLWLLKEGSEFHRRAREFLARFDRDMNPHIQKKAGVRVALTSFSFYKETKQ